MNSLTWGAMLLGLGVTNFRRIKHKLNTKTSTESDMVGERNYVPYNILYTMFIYHQGYLNKSDKCFQYNQSAMKMEMNGRNSCIGN